MGFELHVAAGPVDCHQPAKKPTARLSPSTWKNCFTPRPPSEPSGLQKTDQKLTGKAVERPKVRRHRSPT